MHGQSVPVWAAETMAGSVLYTKAHFPGELAMVLGNEALGVGKEVLALCDAVIEIPVYGFKNSMNVATSCAVVGYRIIEAMEQKKAL